MIAVSAGPWGASPTYDQPVEREAPGGPESQSNSPWRPDADVRFEHPPMRPFGDAEDASVDPSDGDARTANPSLGPADADPSSADRRASRRVIGGFAVGALLLGGVVWTTTGPSPRGVASIIVPTTAASTAPADIVETVVNDGLPLGGGPAGACGVARLPTRLDPAWSAGLPEVRSVRSDMAISEQNVVAIVGLDTPDASLADPTELIALELATGAIRWRSGLGAAASGQQVLGIVDGVVIVEQNAPDRSFKGFVAFDEVDGSELWSLQSPSPSQVHLGSEVLVFETPADTTTEGYSSSGDSSLRRQVTVVDPITGEAFLSHVGVLSSIEPGPLLVIRAGGKVLGADLSADVSSFSLLGTLEDPAAMFAVSGSTVLSVDGSGTTVRSSRAQQTSAVSFEPLGEVVAPDAIIDIEPLGGFDLLISGEDTVFGASQNSPRYALRWQVAGDVLERTASDRGSIVLVESPSADEQFVVDASTGRTITSVPDVAGRWSSFSMATNGVVVLERDGASATRVAYDLDGNVVWKLDGSGPLTVGRDVVVDIEARSDPLGVGSEPTRLVAYVSDADSTTGDCPSNGEQE